MRIHKLKDDVVQRIAAGEVIQKPSNAIKELLENSLDAGATIINVTVQEGGYKAFSIQDNGHGILKEDLPLLCERYATSKLARIEDLWKIGTFGFRGEALASISHISRITVTSKTADSKLGIRANYLDGKLIGEPLAIAANSGTIIQIQDLFYNNPVRVNTTTAQRTDEYNKILDIVQKYAISKAGKCAFSCRREGGTVDFTSRLEQSNANLARLVYGEKLEASLLSLSTNKVSGLISDAYYQQKSFTFTVFINGRLVDFARLKRAIGNVYGELLFTQTYPFVFLLLSVPSEELDVNVHPTKREVILLNEDQVIEGVLNEIRAELSNQSTVKPAKLVVRNTKVAEGVPEKILGIDTKDTSPTVPTKSNPFDLMKSARQDARRNFQQRQRDTDHDGRQYFKQNARPFEQIHTDHTNMTLDMFLHRTKKEKKNLEAVAHKKIDPIAIDGSSLMMESSLGLTEQANPFDSTPESFVKIRESISTRLIEESNSNASEDVTEILKKHVFVGVLDVRRIFLQYDTSLLLADLPRLTTEWSFIQLLHHGLSASTLKVPILINDALDAFWNQSATMDLVDPSISKTELKKEILSLLGEKSEYLRNYQIYINNDKLLSIPLVCADIKIEPNQVGAFLFRLAIDSEWSSSDDDDDGEASELARSIFELLAEFQGSLINTSDIKFLEHELFPLFRKLPAGCKGYSSLLGQNGSLIKIASTHDLYKVFERC